MLKFQQFDRRSGEIVEVNPCLMSFGITEALIPGIVSLLGSAGVGAATAGTIASIAAPALVGAGVGTIGSAITGGDLGQGALFGGLGGALMPTLGALGVTGKGGALSGLFGSGSSTPSWAGSVMDDGTVLDAAGHAPGAMSIMDDGSLASMSGPADAVQTAGAMARGVPAAEGTGGALANLGLPATLGILSMIGQMSNRPKTTAAPTPPGLNTPWNPAPANTLARTQNPFSGSYYTYGQNPEASFFNNNALVFQQQPQAAMARGGALRDAIARGKYSQGGGGALSHFSTGGGSNYVDGSTGGQDDAIPASLSDGEYVMDASTVSRLGDGNNDAGAHKLDQMRHMIANDAGSKQVVQHQTSPALSYLKAVA